VLQRASAALAGTLERLCDHDLSDRARVDGTEQLNSDVGDLRQALETFGDAVSGTERPPLEGDGIVTVVARSRWRRHGWGR